MADKRDYYEVLGVAKGASADDIKKSYRKLARKHHPDVNLGDKGAEKRFKELSEAYAVLSDKEKKAQYDQFGHAGQGGAGFDFSNFDFGGFRTGGFDVGGFTYEDLFGDLFAGGRGGARGGRSRQQAPSRGQSLNYQVKISFEDAYLGAEVPVSYEHEASCDRCSGSGAEPGSGTSTCPTCKGSGQKMVSQGAFQFAQACPQCHGKGSVISNPCTTCRGQGAVRKTERINVKIPAGVDTGSKVRVAGKGNTGANGGPPGDLFIVVQVGGHKLFKRDGADISFDLPVTFMEAASGAKIEIPLPDGGKTVLSVPPGTQGGQKLRLKDKGFPKLKGRGRGHLHAVVKIRVPKAPKGKAAELMQELEKELEMDPREGLW